MRLIKEYRRLVFIKTSISFVFITGINNWTKMDIFTITNDKSNAYSKGVDM
jgi:hypothetical protein